jgi:hypothetical protein
LKREMVCGDQELDLLGRRRARGPLGFGDRRDDFRGWKVLDAGMFMCMMTHSTPLLPTFHFEIPQDPRLNPPQFGLENVLWGS